MGLRGGEVVRNHSSGVAAGRRRMGQNPRPLEGRVQTGPPVYSIARLVRLIFGTATIVLLLAAILVRSDPRLFVASAACGAIWWVWDLLVEYVAAPLGDWVARQLLGGGIGALPPQVRPNLEEVIRLLESHLQRGASRKVDINAAIRLEEIYRTAKKDPVRARAAIRLAKERYPDAPELARYDLDDDDEGWLERLGRGELPGD